MARSKNFSKADWEALEAVKKNSLSDLRRELESVLASRLDLLEKQGTGEKVDSEIALLSAREARIRSDIEDTESLLRVIPARRKSAEGAEVEAFVEKLLEIDKSLPGLATPIDAAAEALVVAVKAFVKRRDELDQNEGRRLAGGYRENNGSYQPFEVLESVAFFAHKHKVRIPGLEVQGFEHDWRPMSANVSSEKYGLRRAIRGRVDRIRKKAAWLRGEFRYLNFCPKCYESLGSVNRQKCSICGYDFDEPQLY